MSDLISVLVVDDEEIIRGFIVSTVEMDLPANCIEATNGKQAIEKLKTKHFDIVLCDYNMPGGNGRSVFEFVRNMNTPPKFLLVTSEHHTRISDIITKDGCAHLDKPFEFTQLTRAICNLLDIIPVQKSESDFAKIKKSYFKDKTILDTDVFVKLRDTHFVKYISGQCELTETDKARLNKIQTDDVYIRVDELNKILKEQQREVFISEILPENTVEHSFSITQVSTDLTNLGLKKFVDDKELMDLTQNNLKTVFALSYKVRAISGLLDWVNKSELSTKKLHSVLLTLFCNIILKNLPSFFDFKAYLSLGYAAVLHDINLDDYIIENESQILNSIMLKSHINKSEQETLVNHVQDILPLIKNWPHCPHEVLEIIEQHHEQPNGCGFPKHLTGNKIGNLSAVFNVAHDMAALVWERKSGNELKSSLEKLHNNYLGHKQFEEPLRILEREVFSR